MCDFEMTIKRIIIIFYCVRLMNNNCSLGVINVLGIVKYDNNGKYWITLIPVFLN